MANNFKSLGVSEDAFKRRLFPYSLRDRAKAWLNSLEPNSITTWNKLAEKFLTKYVPPIKNARIRNDIISFQQTEDESLFEAWERFKDLLKKCPHHGISICIQMEAFYNGLTPPTRLMLDASSRGALLSKSYNEAYELIEGIAANSYQWSTARATTSKGTGGLHEVSEVITASAQLSVVTHMLKSFTTTSSPAVTQPSIVEQVILESGRAAANAISCVFYGGDHLFEECPNNLASVNYVGNFNGDNNPYSNTYNPGWRQHPNVSWSNTQTAPGGSNNSNKPSHSPGFSPQS